MNEMNKIMNKIKKQAIKHYDEMITWVETQDPKKMPNENKMEKAIKQNWFSPYCSYCQYYDINCSICELRGETPKDCCCGLWNKMSFSLTWEEWLRWARQLKKYIIKHG